MDNNLKNKATGWVIAVSMFFLIAIVSNTLFKNKEEGKSVIKDKTLWVYSVDEKDRPITSCLEMDQASWSSMVVSMNCQKSIVPNIILCSQNRAVSMFNNKEKCEENRNHMLKANGEYSL